MSEKNSKYPFRSIKILSWIQIACGLLSVLWQIANMCLHDLVGVAAAGLWCGAAYILAGSLGVAASKNTKACGIISWLSFSLMALVFGLTLLAISIIGVLLETMSPETGFNTESTTPYPNREIKLTIDAFLGACALTATICCIMAIVISAKELCRRRKIPYEQMQEENGHIAVGALTNA